MPKSTFATVHRRSLSCGRFGWHFHPWLCDLDYDELSFGFRVLGFRV